MALVDARGYADAARWMQERHYHPEAVSGTAQVAYLVGARPVLPPSTPQEALDQIRQYRVGCFVYDERDVASLPAMVHMLEACEFLDPPVRIAGSPGRLGVWAQFVR